MKTNKQKTLVVVESPTKARKLAEYLGDGYTILASKGHIVDLAKGGKHKLGIDIDKDFKPHYVILDDQVHTLQAIMDAAKQAKMVILCSDPDREGEAISYHIAQRLSDFGVPIIRAEIHEITKKGVLAGLKETREIDMKLFAAQECRRLLDRLVGFMASPFLMQYYGPSLSAGRVQSVITRMIVDREEEITTFKPEEYYNIHAQLAKGVQSFVAKYEGKINNEETAKQIKEELKKSLYVVSSVEASEEKRKPFPPLITAKLQQIMSKRFGMNSSRTMSAAQSLYENGHITYHRTDSTRVSDDAIKDVRAWLKDNGYDIPKSANRYKNSNDAQNAHEAIRPTDITNAPSTMSFLSDDEKQVYEIIWQYFLASQMMPAIYNTLKVSISLKDNQKHTLIASGKALKYKGFLEMLGVIDNNSIDIPSLTVGDELKLSGEKPVSVEKKQTQPPPRFSEHSLIETLEKKNIGRPATYATLLDTITSRGYVEKDNVYRPTELGKKITEELVKWFGFLNYDYTAKLEMELDQIAEGKIDRTDMLKSFYKTFSKQLKNAYMGHGSRPCPKCDGFLKEIKLPNGNRFFGCFRWPHCSYTENIENVA